MMAEMTRDATERAMLGSVLLDPSCFTIVQEYISSPDCLASELHREILSSMERCQQRHGSIDTVILFEDLLEHSNDAIGIASQLAAMTADTPTSANVETYARLVLEAHLRRSTAKEAARLSRDSHNGKISMEEIHERSAKMADMAVERLERERVQTTEDLAAESIQRLQQLVTNNGIIGLKTGIPGYDQITGGLVSGMHIIAARPSVGKTALALNIARNVAILEKKKVLVLSVEMSKEELMDRFVLLEGEIDKRKLATGFLGRKEAEKIAPAASRIAYAPIEIVKYATMSPARLRRALQIHSDCELVIIDYLQLMGVDGFRGNRQEEVSKISREVKSMSGEFNIPIIALSQLKREAAEQPPRLSDLRESGSIEQDADTVLLLHPDKERGVITAAMAKGRTCGTGIFEIHFNKLTQRMGGVESNPVSEPIENTYNDWEDE